MKIKRIVATLAVVMLALVLVAGLSSSAWAEKKPYKIGVNLALSGPIGGMLAYVKNGMILEQDRINAAGGIDGHPLELIWEDNALDITKTANINKKFVRDKEVLAIIGPIFSTATPTVTPIAERGKMPEIVLCPSSPAEREWKQKWVFYIAHGDPIVAARIIDLAKFRGYKKIYAFVDQDPCYIGIVENMISQGKECGIEVVRSKETFHTTDTDVTPQILKFKDELAGYDAIFISTHGGLGPTVVRNLRTQGVEMPVMGPHGWGFAFTIGLGKGIMEGAQLASGKACAPDQLPDSDRQKTVILDFDKRMKERWENMHAEQLSGHGYDAIWILNNALKRAGENPTRAQLRDAIEQTKDFIGITGIYTYTPEDHEGLDKYSLAPLRIENNRFNIVDLGE
ncbi:MAG: ABC transporter substrate-binding protein [Deltaproteobacteria bacterium]|nr:ABC transporter substrate-binding protein [Deltaproteobacteria bacterium]